jgi:hypothetical protein
MIKKYREQIISVDGCQFVGTNQQELITWGAGKITETPQGGLQLEIAPGNFAPVNNTDWVINDPYHNWSVLTAANFLIAYAPGP